MRTGDFLDELLEGVAATVSRVSARRKTNIAQNAILGVDNSITCIQPDAYFTSAAGVYSYQANGSFFSARGVTPGDVLTDDIRNVRWIRCPDTRRIERWPFPWEWDKAWRQDSFAQLSISTTESAGAGLNDCRIDLNKNWDVGTTTDMWVGRLYRWPRQIISDDTILEIPDDFFFLLKMAVKRLIEDDQYGRPETTSGPYDTEMQRFINKYGNPVRQDTPRFLDSRW